MQKAVQTSTKTSTVVVSLQWYGSMDRPGASCIATTHFDCTVTIYYTVASLFALMQTSVSVVLTFLFIDDVVSVMDKHLCVGIS